MRGSKWAVTGAAVITLTAFFSCNSNQTVTQEKVHTALCDSLFGKKDHDFRMVSFGDSRESFPLGDGPNIMENERDRVVEKLEMHNADSTYAEVYYVFHENRLAEAEINIITHTDSLLSDISATLVKTLNLRYGKSLKEGGFTYWTGKGTGGYSIEIYLSNRTNEFRLPTLQLTFRAELIETPRMAFAYAV